MGRTPAMWCGGSGPLRRAPGELIASRAMSTPRTRFAPSPTGFLHIGGARTALFNWAYARRHAGQLVLRVEDTDRERSSAESEARLLEALAWLGVDWDEGPHRQSERRERHLAVIQELIAKDRAYRCLCTREELEERRQAAVAAGGHWTYDGRCAGAGHGPDCGPHTVRLRVPGEGRLAWEDLVFGHSGKDAADVGDAIIRRSDGDPLYHLAVVVDDRDMGIDLVIRGADHHPNTPLQLAIYAALDAPPPRFAHVPLIVNEAGKKLSKRRDAVAVEHFRDAGYLPQALCNWLIRLGWSHGDQEIFSRDEIADLFDLGSVGRAAARADTTKLQWINQHYLKTVPGDALLPALLPRLEARVGHPVPETPELARLVELLRERSRTLEEMADRARFLATDLIAYDEKAAKKHLKPAALDPLSALHDRLEELPAWDEPSLEATFEAVAAEHGDLPMGKLAQPVRVAVTGEAVSPGIYETLAVLGRERTLKRLADAIHHLRHSA